MSYLLDTHALLWWLSANKNISREARNVIENPAHIVFVSAVTAWEISIKRATRKLKMPGNLNEHMQRNDLHPLNITIEHATAADQLPLHHRDPFDRMLVAQAMLEDLTLVTRDQNIAKYAVKFITT